MVTLNLEDGMDCDVIGDVHGMSLSYFRCIHSLTFMKDNSMTCFICSRSPESRATSIAC